MVELGRKSRQEPAAKSLIATLSRGSPYEQILTLTTCHGSRDVAVAKQLLSANSKFLKKQAINFIASLGSDDELFEALKVVPASLQRQTVLRIRNFSPRCRRSDVIERFLNHLNQEGGNQTLFRYLVPFGSEATLEKHLPDLLDDFSLLDWTHLSKSHPKVAQRTLYGMIEKSEVGDVLLQRTLTHVFTQWISHDRTIKFAQDLVQKFPLNLFPVGWSGSRFLKRCPRQAVDTTSTPRITSQRASSRTRLRKSTASSRSLNSSASCSDTLLSSEALSFLIYPQSRSCLLMS